MPKVSKTTATKEEFGPVTDCNAEIDGYRVGFATFHQDIDATKARAGTIRELAQLIKDFPGESPVYADLITSQGTKVYAFGPQYKVKPAPDFYAEVKMLLGESAVA